MHYFPLETNIMRESRGTLKDKSKHTHTHTDTLGTIKPSSSILATHKQCWSNMLHKQWLECFKWFDSFTDKNSGYRTCEHDGYCSSREGFMLLSDLQSATKLFFSPAIHVLNYFCQILCAWFTVSCRSDPYHIKKSENTPLHGTHLSTVLF